MDCNMQPQQSKNQNIILRIVFFSAVKTSASLSTEQFQLYRLMCSVLYWSLRIPAPGWETHQRAEPSNKMTWLLSSLMYFLHISLGGKGHFSFIMRSARHTAQLILLIHQSTITAEVINEKISRKDEMCQGRFYLKRRGGCTFYNLYCLGWVTGSYSANLHFIQYF